MDLATESRIVMTLDAGGTNLRFAAMRGGKPVTETVSLPSNGDDLTKCLANIVQGFTEVKALCPEPPSAISFAFPGPADYPNGIIGDLGNLQGFRGGVALGPMLEDQFDIPVFINNDGDLFVYGEAISGLLPHVNGLLEKTGSSKRYKNLFGVRRVYSELTGIPYDEVPEPKELFEIANGKHSGNLTAAQEAFRRLGESAGDALGSALTLIDGLAVIGGGVSGAWPIFLPALVDELNSTYTGPDGKQFRRLASTAFNLEDPAQLEIFLKGDNRTIKVPGSGRSLDYDPLQRVGVGMSRLGTSEAVAIGAYAFALQKLGPQ